MDITIFRHPFDMQTRLCDIPRDWLLFIEPKIHRMGGHWYWQGTVAKGKYPLLYLPERGGIMPTKRFIAHMFFEFNDKGTYVVNGPSHVCADLMCCHPRHLIVTDKHPRSLDYDALLNPMA